MAVCRNLEVERVGERKKLNLDLITLTSAQSSEGVTNLENSVEINVTKGE